MPDQEDPFKKYGGKQIDEPQDPFKKYGGQAIAEPVKKKGILSGVGGVALQNGSQGGNALLNGGGGGRKIDDVAKGAVDVAEEKAGGAEFALNKLGLNVTFTPEAPINALEQPKERDFSTTQSALGLNEIKPKYVNLDNPQELSKLVEDIDKAVLNKRGAPLSKAMESEAAQLKLNRSYRDAVYDAKHLKEALASKAQENTVREFYEARLPTAITDEDLLRGGRHYIGQLAPSFEKRNKKILEGGEDLGEENEFTAKSLFADLLINNPNVSEEDKAQAKALKDNLYATHPKYAAAKAWDIISAYNHLKDNKANSGWWRSRPTIGQVKRWMNEPELQEMFAGNEAAYEVLKQQLDNNFGLAQQGVPNEAVSTMVDNMKADDVAVGGFLNKFSQAIGGGFESIGNIGRSDAKRLKSMMNPTMVRGSFTGNYGLPGQSAAIQQEFNALEEKKKEGQELTPEEKSKYKALSRTTGAMDWIDRTGAGMGDLTGQVGMQILLTKGVGAALKPLAGGLGNLTRTINPRAISATTAVPMGISAGGAIGLSSFDQTRQQAVYNFPDDPAKQNIYTTAMTVANAVSERIFKDEKALKAITNELRGDIATMLKNVSVKNIARADVKKMLSDKLVKFGKQWGVEGSKEASEEAVVQAVDEVFQATMEADDYDGSKAAKRIGDTYFSTLLNGALVSGLAARANVKQNQLNKVGLYKMAENADYYADYINRMREEGHIDKAEADEKLMILVKGAEIAASEPQKVSAQNTRKRAEYFTHQLNIALNEEKLANSNDKNEQEEIKSEIKQSEEAAKDVYESDTQEQEILKKSAKEIKDPTYKKMAEDAAKSPETALQFIQEIREQATGAVQGENDLGNARSGILNTWGETLTNFVSPSTPDLGFNPETNEATSEAAGVSGSALKDENGLNEDANKILGLHDNGVNFDLFDNNKLRQIAKDNGIDLPEGVKNADIIEALKKKQNASKEQTQKAFEDLTEADIDKLSAAEKAKLYKENGITNEDGSEITEKDIQDNPLQYSYDFMASSNSGKWNSANSELEAAVQGNKKQYSLYKLMAGEFDTFKEFVDFINSKNYGDKIEYTERMRRADETMTSEERKSAIDSYNKSAEDRADDKAQKGKDILKEHGFEDETEYSPQEIINKFPLKGVQKVIFDIIKNVAEKLGIKVKFSAGRITEGFEGSNNPLNGEILISPHTLKNGRIGEVLVHEVVHALTTKIISRVNSGVETGLTSRQVAAVKGLNKLYEAVRSDNKLDNKYPVKDIFEFIAHLTNDNFVKELESKDRNFLQKVVDFIADILGISNANELAKRHLKDIISDGTFLEKEGITVKSSDYGANKQGSKLSPKEQLLEKIRNNSKELSEKYHSDKENDIKKIADKLFGSKPKDPSLSSNTPSQAKPKAGSGGVGGGSKIAKRIRDNIKDLPEKDLGDAEANKNWNDIRESRKRIKSMSDEELLKEVQKGMGGKLINQAIYESYFGMDITAKDIETELQSLKEQPKAEADSGGVVDVEAKKAEINKRYDEEVSEYERKIKQAEEDIAAKKGGTYLPSKNKQKEAIADINDNRRFELEQLEKQSSQPEAGSVGVGGDEGSIANKVEHEVGDLVSYKGEPAKGEDWRVVKVNSNGTLRIEPKFNAKPYDAVTIDIGQVELIRSAKDLKIGQLENSIRDYTAKRDAEKKQSDKKFWQDSIDKAQEELNRLSQKFTQFETKSVSKGDGFDYVRSKFSQEGGGGKRLSDKESIILNKVIDKLIERAEKENGVKRNELKQATWKTNDGYTVTEFFENGRGGTRIITPKGEEINLFDNKYKGESGRDISYFSKAHEPFKEVEQPLKEQPKAPSKEQTTASKVAEQPKIDYESKREEEILDAGKPEIRMEFLPAKELVDSKDPIGNKKVHGEIKDRYKKLRELLDCLWAKK